MALTALAVGDRPAAQAPAWQWARGIALATVAGSASLTSLGSYDLFVAKFTPPPTSSRGRSGPAGRAMTLPARWP